MHGRGVRGEEGASPADTGVRREQGSMGQRAGAGQVGRGRHISNASTWEVRLGTSFDHKEIGRDEFERGRVRLSRGDIQNPKDIRADLSREHIEKEKFYKVVFWGDGVRWFDMKREREQSYLNTESRAIFCRSLSGAGWAWGVTQEKQGCGGQLL